MTSEHQGDANSTELTVSGDGTWKKRGYTSLFGVTSLIGYYSGKIVDIFVKSFYCKQCEICRKKLNTEEYEDFGMKIINLIAAQIIQVLLEKWKSM